MRTWLFNVSPAGTALTVANVKSVDNASPPAGGVAVGTGTGTIASSTDSPAAGSGWAAEFAINASSTALIRTTGISAHTTGTAQAYFEANSMPTISGGATGQVAIMNLRSATSNANIYVYVRANGTVVLVNGSTVITGATGVWTADPRRVKLSYVIGGTVVARIYDGESTTPLETLTATAGGTTGTIERMDVGVLTNSLTATWTLRVAAVQIDETGADIAPYLEPNDPPMVTAGPTQVVASGASVTLSFGVSDIDGTIASRATTYDYPASGGPTVGSGGTDAPTLTAGTAPARYAVRQTATDDDGATGFAITEVFVPVAGSADMRPEPTNGTGVGTWTIAGGSATHGATLADESNTTYVESPSVSGAEQRLRQRYHPSYDKASAQTTNTLCTNEGTATGIIRLYEGATLRQAWTHTGLTTSDQTFTDAFSSGTIAAITDWKNLWIELAVVAS